MKLQGKKHGVRHLMSVLGMVLLVFVLTNCYASDLTDTQAELVQRRQQLQTLQQQARMVTQRIIELQAVEKYILAKEADEKKGDIKLPEE